MSTSQDSFDRLLDEMWSDLNRGALRPFDEYRARGPSGRLEELEEEYRAIQASRAPGATRRLGDGQGNRKEERRETGLPESIGRYHPIGELRGGGMGRLFVAEDPTLGRKVVLKTVKASRLGSILGRESLERLQVEARVGGRLAHPNLCPVLDVLTDEDDDVHFVVMPLIEGEPLSGILSRARQQQSSPGSGDEFWLSLPSSSRTPSTTSTASEGVRTNGKVRSSRTAGELPAVLRLVETLARAVHKAHEADVVHRDLKPGNVIIRPDGEPVVLDFGLALDLHVLEESDDDVGGESTHPERVTLPGAVFGTIPYMSPEQAEGRTEEIDRRTDIYALGAILYELLTLHQPFEHPDTQALLNRIVRGDPLRPRKWNSRIPADLEAVCLKCLDRDPERRYASALELAEELESVRLLKSTRARPLTTLGVVWRMGRRNPVATAALAGAAILLVALIAVFFTSVPPERLDQAVLVTEWIGAVNRDSPEATTLRPGVCDALGDDELVDRLEKLARQSRAEAIEEWIGRARTRGDEEGLLSPRAVTTDPQPVLRFRAWPDTSVDYVITVRNDEFETVARVEAKGRERDGNGIIAVSLAEPLIVDPETSPPRRFIWSYRAFIGRTSIKTSEPASFIWIPPAAERGILQALGPEGAAHTGGLLRSTLLLMLGRAEEALAALDAAGPLADPDAESHAAGVRKLTRGLAAGEDWACRMIQELWIP